MALPLVFVPVPEAKAVKNRIHLDLATESVAHQAAEVERLLGLGAVPADIGQGDVPWVVLADPEGNEFCVLDPRPVYFGTGPVAAVVADCRDPAAVAGFWELATGWVPGDSVAFCPPARSRCALQRAWGRTWSCCPRQSPGRSRTGFTWTWLRSPGHDQAAAVAALLAAGAVTADVGQGSASWTVLADPEGSEFCVLSPR